MERHAVITEEMLDRLRSKIGVEYHPREPFYNTAATRDAIRHFAHGIGDTNPLWTDEDYIRKSRYSSIIAPPCFLTSVYWPGGVVRGLPGIHAWHSGIDWEFYKPILLNDEFICTEILTDLVEKSSKMAGRTFIQYADILYRNQRGELVAKATGWVVRAERAASKQKGKYSQIQRATYTKEEIQKIYDDYDREEIRGSNPRYWEDVTVGEDLTPVVKGPLSMRDIIAWTMGGGSPFIRAHGLALAFQRRHPATAMTDSTTGTADVPELVHMEDSKAQELGIPGAYDYGPQRICWLGHLLTNWMGDDGILKRLYAEVRRFNFIGDTTWCKGKVTEKYINDGEHLVDIECCGEDQRGEITMPGRATVSLPSRG